MGGRAYIWVWTQHPLCCAASVRTSPLTAAWRVLRRLTWPGGSVGLCSGFLRWSRGGVTPIGSPTCCTLRSLSVAGSKISSAVRWTYLRRVYALAERSSRQCEQSSCGLPFRLRRCLNQSLPLLRLMRAWERRGRFGTGHRTPTHSLASCCLRFSTTRPLRTEWHKIGEPQRPASLAPTRSLGSGSTTFRMVTWRGSLPTGR